MNATFTNLTFFRTTEELLFKSHIAPSDSLFVIFLAIKP
jgi:hypothetical protein